MLFLERKRRCAVDFDLLGRRLADLDVVHLSGVGDDRLVDFVACDASRRADNHAAKRADRDLRGAASDVDDDAAGRLEDW